MTSQTFANPSLNWPAINREIHTAILLSTKTKFAGSKDAANYILSNPNQFPLTSAMYPRYLKGQVTEYCKRMGWVRWSTGKHSGVQKIFIIPGRE